MSHADEIDLGEVISGVVLFSEPTQTQYAVWLRRLAAFLNVPALNATGLIPKEYMTDDNLAKFIYQIHTLKVLYAALNSGSAIFLIPNTTLICKVMTVYYFQM